MPDTTKMTLSDIHQEVSRRGKRVDDLKNRLDKLGGELQEVLLDIDELEGNSAPRKRRGQTSEADPALAVPGGEPDAGEGKAGSPEVPARKAPSIVDAAVDVLRSWGKPMNPAELALRIEERGVVCGNTQQVLLMAAGRRSRIAKNEDGTIALIPEDGPKPV
jgi:hypothetical protein